MIIHGDNLSALKSLLPQYEGKIRCIYIDPPYNTGNEGWVYNDNVNDPRIRKWLGEVVGSEGEDLSRHDKEKIKTLREAYMQERFYDLIERDRVFTDATYAFPMVITPSESTDKVPKSLYEAEWDKMNNFERRTLDVIAGCEGVLWWHRIIEKKGFRINAFINHYPDFIVMMKSGKIIMVEAKGDDRDNGDSRTKLKLGKTWAAQAGRMFKYYMTFDHNSIDGAYNLEEFAEVLKDL